MSGRQFPYSLLRRRSQSMLLVPIKHTLFNTHKVGHQCPCFFWSRRSRRYCVFVFGVSRLRSPNAIYAPCVTCREQGASCVAQVCFSCCCRSAFVTHLFWELGLALQHTKKAYITMHFAYLLKPPQALVLEKGWSAQEGSCIIHCLILCLLQSRCLIQRPIQRNAATQVFLW